MRVFALASLFLLVGCDGAIDAPGFGDAGTDAANPAQGSEAGGDAAVDCNALMRRHDELLRDARTCCAVCTVVQCTEIIDDLCCPVVVTQKRADLLQVIADIKKSCGPIACAGDCATPVKQCSPENPNEPASRGTCL
jgi:hypothetical protein